LGNIFRKKNLQDLNGEVSLHAGPEGSTGLHRVLNVKDLTLMGVAAVIGGGIFSTIGSAAYNGGPGVILLFVITAITCGFTALCYAEFASRIPVAGSAYTYSYVSFGEVVAWIIGWALILEYAIGNIVVAISWSAYFNNILHAMGLDLPKWLTVGYQTASNIHDAALASGADVSGLVFTNAPRILGVPFYHQFTRLRYRCAHFYVGLYRYSGEQAYRQYNGDDQDRRASLGCRGWVLVYFL